MARLSLALGALVPLTIAACATDPRVVTWDDAITAPSTAPPGATRRKAHSTTTHNDATRAASHDDHDQHARREAPRRRASPDDQFGGGDDRESASRTPAGILIDRALAEFNARRTANRRAPRRSAKHAVSWLKVLAEIDDATSIPPNVDDLGAFVRARVVLEVELQRDRDLKRRLPKDLPQRIDETLSSVDSRVAELRLVAPPGSLGPSTYGRAGDIVTLRSPVAPMLVTSPFGIREDPLHGRRRFHAGVDFGAPEGSMVYSSAKGVIIYANWQGGYGRHVVIDHGDGLRTHYSHLDEIFVEAGELVKPGDTIGSVGQTGRATGPHLHFAVSNHEGQFLDPLELLDRRVSRKDLRRFEGVSRIASRR